MESKVLLSELEKSVIQEMHRLQFSKLSISKFRRVCGRFSEFVKEKGFENTFSEELGRDFLKAVYDYPPPNLVGRLSGSVHLGVRCIRYLGEYRMYGVFVRKRRDVKQEYRWSENDIHMVELYKKFVNSLDTSSSTKKSRVHQIKLFYEYMCFKHIESIRDITSETISGYILSMQGGSPVYAMHRLRTLKFFLKFLFESGSLDKDLTSLIPRIKTPVRKNVPALWDKDEIVKLLGSIDRGSPCGKRDYAVLSLAIQLGIRISDIANLKLDNLKWERKEIEFHQQKTGTKVIYPMLDEIGWSIIDYIRYSRPKTDSAYLFLIFNPPYTNLQSGSIGDILRRQMRRCGIRKQKGVSGGMHSLRHALARNLLEQNIPLPLLSEIMGHTSVVSSSPYLKVDIEGLRHCALSLGGLVI